MSFSPGTIEFIKSRNERKVEAFFVDLATEIRSIPVDGWEAQFKLETRTEPAVFGSWAGTAILIVLSLPPCIESTLKLWGRIRKALKKFKKKGEHPRIMSGYFFEGIAQHELLIRGIHEFELRTSEIIGPYKDLSPELLDSLQANLDPGPRARLVFQSKRGTIVIEISNEGDILQFRLEQEPTRRNGGV